MSIREVTAFRDRDIGNIAEDRLMFVAQRVRGVVNVHPLGDAGRPTEGVVLSVFRNVAGHGAEQAHLGEQRCLGSHCDPQIDDESVQSPEVNRS